VKKARVVALIIVLFLRTEDLKPCQVNLKNSFKFKAMPQEKIDQRELKSIAKRKVCTVRASKKLVFRP